MNLGGTDKETLPEDVNILWPAQQPDCRIYVPGKSSEELQTDIQFFLKDIWYILLGDWTDKTYKE